MCCSKCCHCYCGVKLGSILKDNLGNKVMVCGQSYETNRFAVFIKSSSPGEIFRNKKYSNLQELVSALKEAIYYPTCED